MEIGAGVVVGTRGSNSSITDCGRLIVKIAIPNVMTKKRTRNNKLENKIVFFTVLDIDSYCNKYQREGKMSEGYF
jgi:hypothetical protein